MGIFKKDEGDLSEYIKEQIKRISIVLYGKKMTEKEIEAKKDIIEKCIKMLPFDFYDETIDYLIILNDLKTVNRLNRVTGKQESLETFVEEFLVNVGKGYADTKDEDIPSAIQVLKESMRENPKELASNAKEFYNSILDSIDDTDYEKMFKYYAQMAIIEDHIDSLDTDIFTGRIRIDDGNESIVSSEEESDGQFQEEASIQECLNDLYPLITEGDEKFKTVLRQFCERFNPKERKGLINIFNILMYLEDAVSEDELTLYSSDVKEYLEELKKNGFLEQKGKIRTQLKILSNLKFNVNIFLDSAKKWANNALVDKKNKNYYKKAFSRFIRCVKEVTASTDAKATKHYIEELSKIYGFSPFDAAVLLMPYVPYKLQSDTSSDSMTNQLAKSTDEKYCIIREYIFNKSKAVTPFEKIIMLNSLSCKTGIPGLKPSDRVKFRDFLLENPIPSKVIDKIPENMEHKKADTDLNTYLFCEILEGYYSIIDDERKGQISTSNVIENDGFLEIALSQFGSFTQYYSRQRLSDLMDSIGKKLESYLDQEEQTAANPEDTARI